MELIVSGSSILDSSNIPVIQKILDLGLCLVPSSVKNKDNKPKIPWHDWKKITKPLSGVDLLDAVYSSGAKSLAVVGGLISGGLNEEGELSGNWLVIVDIDSKYKPGIDAEIFTEINAIYPDLFEKLRIERTPSGGYHFYYRVRLENGESIPENGGIASRLATEEELIAKPRTPRHDLIEIKNVCQCYPSQGYVITKEPIGGISTFTFFEHSSIIRILKDFDEIENNPIEEKKWVKENKGSSDLYDVSPWVDFNNGHERSEVFERYSDWKYMHWRRTVNKYFIKPGKGEHYKEDGAIYRTKSNRYMVYTPSSDLNPRVSYTPSDLLCILKFGGDKSACFSWLVANKYGKIKEYREKRLIKKSLTSGIPLPANVSEKGLKEFEEEKLKIDTKYPHNIFWEEDFDVKLGESKFNISREKVYSVSEKLGFCIKESGGNFDICFIKKDFIEIVDKRFYFNSLKEYINDAGIEVIDCFESFLQKCGDFTITRLIALNDDLILKSTKEISYKFFNNGFVEVTAFGFTFKSYSELEGKLVWKQDIQNRDYKFCEEGLEKQCYYYDFLSKAIFGGIDDYLLKTIGFYAHDYKATTTPYIAILCEVCENPAMGGGSGKNVFTNLFNFCSSVLNKPADNVKFDDTMLRTRKQQKIISLNDAAKNFKYISLRELSSGDGEVGKKFKQEEVILAKDMPKFIVNTGFSFDPHIQGLKRRLIPIEFTEFFTKQGGVDIHYGIDFPSKEGDVNGWKEIDWIGYDHIILTGIQEYLKAGCKLRLKSLSDTGWVKQFCQVFKQPTYDFIKSRINDWVSLKEVPINSTFNSHKEDFYKENGIPPNYQLGSIRMNEALQEFCNNHGIKFTPTKNIGRDSQGKQINAKVFEKISDLKEFEESGFKSKEYEEEEVINDDLPF